MYSNFIQAFEHLEELTILEKAIIGMEYYMGIPQVNISDLELQEGKEWFLKYWLRQIQCYNRPEQLSQIASFNPNMFDLQTVREELFENILFVQSRVLEAY